MGQTNVDVLYEDDAFIEEVTGALTLDAADSGKILKMTSSATITLPSTAVGLHYTVVNGGTKDGEVQVTVSPAALDQIIGVDITAADDKDLVNTLATAKVGDRLSLFGDGSSGWYVMSMIGTWAGKLISGNGA